MALLTREQILTAELNEGQKRLWRFIEAVKSDAQPTKEDMMALAEAFKEILDGEDPKKALEISKQQSSGRKPKTASQVDREEVQPVIEIIMLRKEKNLTVEKAKEVVSEKLNIPHGTLDRYYKKHRKMAMFFYDSYKRGVEKQQQK